MAGRAPGAEKGGKKKAAARPAPAPVAAAVSPAAVEVVGVSRAEAAAALGVPPNRISQWIADGAPVLRSGQRGVPSRYDVEALREWKEARGEETDGKLSLEAERAKLAREQRLKLEREERVRSGELVEFADVVAEAKACLLAMRTRLLALPRQLAQAGVITRDQEPKVTTLVYDALSELARWKWTPPEPAPDVEDGTEEDAEA